MNPSNHFEIPGSVSLQTGKGCLPLIRVERTASTAEIYLHGARTTDIEGDKDSSGLIGIQHHGEKGQTYMCSAICGSRS